MTPHRSAVDPVSTANPRAPIGSHCSSDAVENRAQRVDLGSQSIASIFSRMLECEFPARAANVEDATARARLQPAQRVVQRMPSSDRAISSDRVSKSWSGVSIEHHALDPLPRGANGKHAIAACPLGLGGKQDWRDAGWEVLHRPGPPPDHLRSGRAQLCNPPQLVGPRTLEEDVLARHAEPIRTGETACRHP